jgi:16S rRNA (guanine(527)-N(7))-methyltransferase RsmG
MSQERLWEQFFSRQELTLVQQAQFREYYEQLVATNKLHNITAIIDLERVITDHFEDSLVLRKFIACETLMGLGDIGTGAGFPALPLKILYPNLPVVLIEVNAKKRVFLERLSQQFHCTHVSLEELDWRTFLRQTNYSIDLFCARASLHPEELIRVFKPSSPYKNVRLVYWTTETWEPSSYVKPYVVDIYSYVVGVKRRKLVLLKSEGPLSA